MLLGARRWLPGRLRNLLAHLIVGGHSDAAVLLPEEEAILEELLHMGLGVADLGEVMAGSRDLLLHLLEVGHLSGDFGLFLLLL